MLLVHESMYILGAHKLKHMCLDLDEHPINARYITIKVIPPTIDILKNILNTTLLLLNALKSSKQSKSIL